MFRGTFSEPILGGRAVLIMGYDDDKLSTNRRGGNSRTGCYLIRNSWGDSRGDHGYGRILYDYFVLNSNGDVLAYDVWTLTQRERVEFVFPAFSHVIHFRVQL